MVPFKEEIGNITRQIIERYDPEYIILFGSYAKGIAKDDSDIDLCIICNYENKKNMIYNMLMNIKSDRDIDFVLYRPEDWEECKSDDRTVASLIKSEGIVLMQRKGDKEYGNRYN